jgi:hypothetical protein
MKHLELYESYGDRTVVLESRQKRTITFDVVLGKITNLVNESGVRFPYPEGSRYNMNIETWCCNNGFTMDGKDMCPEPKVFGVRASQIPKGDPLRSIFPSKFRKH